MYLKILVILGGCWMLAPQAEACSSHPGVTHQEWSSAIQPDKAAKPGEKAQSLSSDFFSSRAVSSEADQGRRRVGPSYRRPGRMSR